jgi:hypothetical protein
MQYVNQHFTNNMDYPVYIGTWISDGMIYLDVSRHFSAWKDDPNDDDLIIECDDSDPDVFCTEIQALVLALNTAQRNKQLAIWDCANNREIAI